MDMDFYHNRGKDSNLDLRALEKLEKIDFSEESEEEIKPKKKKKKSKKKKKKEEKEREESTKKSTTSKEDMNPDLANIEIIQNDESDEEKKTNKNKYRFHNFIRTIKSKLLYIIRCNLNVILEENKIRQFLKPKDIASEAKTDDNYNIFKMKLREIFSLDISPQIKNYPKDHNENLVKEIKDEPNMVKINEILDLTFFQCLKHFISFEKQNILEKFELEKGYNELIEKLSKDEKDFYEMKLKDFIDEKIKSRNTKKKE